MLSKELGTHLTGFRVKALYQVCYLMDTPDTRECEVRGILDAMDAYQLQEGTIITNFHEEELHDGNRMVRSTSARKWMLSV